MTTAPPPHNFELVRRGYAPAQVDQTMTQIVNDLGAMRRELDSERARRSQLTEQIEAMHAERALMDPSGNGSYRGLGDRIEQIFRLAEEEAREARDTAMAEAEQHRLGAHEETAAARQSADVYAAERRGVAEAEAARIVEEARKEADALRAEAERDARVRRDEAEGIFERNRAKAAQAAADFEATLATRRAEAERAHGERIASAEAALQASQQRSDNLTAESEAIRAEAETNAQRVLDAATAQAEALVRDARATAGRAREDAEREVAALMHRRDSINAQLANVRRMLATLTGTSTDSLLAPEPGEQVEYIEVEYAEEGEEVGDVQVEFVDLDDDESVDGSRSSGDKAGNGSAAATNGQHESSVGSEPADAGHPGH